MESMKKPKLGKKENLDNQMDIWVGYWRANLHRFAEDCGVKLKTFQKILIYLMEYFPMFMYVASRGTGKSFLIALYGVMKCILYPDLIVTIASATKGQAILMIKQYVQFFNDNYPIIGNEIESISTNPQDPHVKFKNGSIFKAVTASDTSRGNRTHVLILEEFAIIKKSIIDSVLKKFGTTPRQPAFLNNPKYSDYPIEPIREIWISSARYKAEWGWAEVKKFFKNMGKEFVENKPYFGIFSSDWSLPVFFKLFDEQKMRKELEAEGGNDEITWSMEMESLWFGQNENSFFSYASFADNREIEKAEYPNKSHEFYGKKKKPEPLKRRDGEIRVLVIDVASTPKKDSDNTVIDYIVAKEGSNGYNRTLKYIETMNGEKVTEQALRIKQLWYDFNIDYVVLDVLNVGRELYAMLTKTTYDTERDIEYPPLICFNDEDYKNWAYEKNGIECVYAFKATPDINHNMAKSLEANLKERKLKFLITESEFKDNATKQNDKYLEKDVHERLELELPYVNTTIMINEILNLEYTIQSGRIKIQEVGKARKDRYSALAMGNYFISQLELENLRQEDEDDWDVIVM